MNAEETKRWLYGKCVDCKRDVLQCPMNPVGPTDSCAMFEAKHECFECGTGIVDGCCSHCDSPQPPAEPSRLRFRAVRPTVPVVLYAIRGWARYERRQARFNKMFGALAPTRKDRKRMDDLARRLLVHAIESGATIKELEELVQRQEAGQ